MTAGTRNARLALLLAAVVALPTGGCGSDRSPTAKPTASVVDERRVGPRLIDLTVRSPAVGRAVEVRLLTPRGWRPDSSRTWPTLYLLHGCCDTYESWTRSTRIEQFRALRDVLVVMPDGGRVGFYSNWLSDGKGGTGPGWETFHLVELRRLLEARYGAADPRAVAGVSMGGLGAMAYAARDTGGFAAAASFSGVLNPLADSGFLLALFSAFTPDPDAIWGNPRRDRDVWAAHDPTELAPELRGMRLYVSAGTGRPGPLDARNPPRDLIEPTVRRQSVAFVRRLNELGIPADTHFYPAGRHAWPYWERDLRRALPLLLGLEPVGGAAAGFSADRARSDRVRR